MAHQIAERGGYLRGVIGDEASVDDFVAFYQELEQRCTERGYDRALVVVVPETQVPGPDRLHTYKRAGFMHGFKLALVCAAWTLYQACNEAERAAAAAASIHVRAFFHEMEAVRWLTADAN
jgi:hypothetical protein